MSDPLIIAFLSILFPLLVAIFYLTKLDIRLFNYFNEKKNKKIDGKSNLTGQEYKYPNEFFTRILAGLKKVWWRIDRFSYPFIALLFKLFGVRYYLTVLSDSEERKLDGASDFLDKSLFARLSHLMNNAVVLQFSLGEMGSHLMENPDVLEGIKHAVRVNKAKVQIVGGPRVDPKTKRIFNLAKDGFVEVYRTPRYFSTHFIIITDKNGEKVVINEGVHEETIWSGDKRHRMFRSITRAIYLYKGKKQHIKALSKEFERRRASGIRITRNPGITPPQNFNNSRLFFRSFLWEGFIVKHIIQPVSICLDIPLL